jgi:hypothetical protein
MVTAKTESEASLSAKLKQLSISLSEVSSFPHHSPLILSRKRRRDERQILLQMTSRRGLEGFGGTLEAKTNHCRQRSNLSMNRFVTSFYSLYDSSI